MRIDSVQQPRWWSWAVSALGRFRHSISCSAPRHLPACVRIQFLSPNFLYSGQSATRDQSQRHFVVCLSGIVHGSFKNATPVPSNLKRKIWVVSHGKLESGLSKPTVDHQWSA